MDVEENEDADKEKVEESADKKDSKMEVQAPQQEANIDHKKIEELNGGNNNNGIFF